MYFSTDKQTLDDLNIFGKPDSSVYEIFNQTATLGGANLLEEMFHHPLASEKGIRCRSSVIQYFVSIGRKFPFHTENFGAIEEYLSNKDERSRLAKDGRNLVSRFNAMVAEDIDFKMISVGVKSIISMVFAMKKFVDSLKDAEKTAYHLHYAAIVELLGSQTFMMLPTSEKYKLSYEELADLDVLLRFKHPELTRKLLYQIYQLDVFMTVAKIAVRLGFVFPGFVSAEKNALLLLEGVYHPQLKVPVANSLEIDTNGNVIFLTGANMAGKSTFMKSLGIAMYLAHMGFPVAAVRMEFSVFDGIFTTINLPDNLNSGTSHFYAEVLRVKKIAKELRSSKKLFVMIDELFRGTNVKDAYEATIAITQGFATKRNSVFVISTHIIEAGAVLKSKCENIRFRYLPTIMNGNRPVYTYQLENGITNDRHGMIIINNEGILEILKRNNP